MCNFRQHDSPRQVQVIAHPNDEAMTRWLRLTDERDGSLRWDGRSKCELNNF